jgi:hypothetical protein
MTSVVCGAYSLPPWKIAIVASHCARALASARSMRCLPDSVSDATARRRLLEHAPNLPGWDRAPVVAALSQALARPVALENDANAAALAEWRFGAGVVGAMGAAGDQHAAGAVVEF